MPGHAVGLDRAVRRGLGHIVECVCRLLPGVPLVAHAAFELFDQRVEVGVVRLPELAQKAGQRVIFIFAVVAVPLAVFVFRGCVFVVAVLLLFAVSVAAFPAAQALVGGRGRFGVGGLA